MVDSGWPTERATARMCSSITRRSWASSCLRAHRAGAMVIGEDLGTVEPWVREYFPRAECSARPSCGSKGNRTEEFTPPEFYRRDTLATVTTHDLPTTAQMLAGEQVDMRVELGLVKDVDAATAKRRRENSTRSLLGLLKERGLMIPDYNDEDVIAAVHLASFFPVPACSRA